VRAVPPERLTHSGPVWEDEHAASIEEQRLNVPQATPRSRE
jgi:hypothetical protein